MRDFFLLIIYNIIVIISKEDDYMQHYYSKSKFVLFQGCHKRLWLEHYKHDEKVEVNNETQLINGNLIGDLAMGLFGNYYLAETLDNNLEQQAINTKQALLRGENVIQTEITSIENGLICFNVEENDIFVAVFQNAN